MIIKTIDCTVLESWYDRLLSLSGTDEGFFVLALHSWIEAYIDLTCSKCTLEFRFTEKLELFKDSLRAHVGDSSELRVIVRIQKEHDLTNKVRHQFKQLTKEEVTAAIYNFLSFLQVAKVPYSRKWDKLKQTLSIWENKKSLPETVQELAELRYSHQKTQTENRLLLEKLERFKEYEKTIHNLNLRIVQITQDLESAKQSLSTKDDKIDHLRSQLNALKLEKENLQKRHDSFSELSTYIEGLLRLSTYTRTRRDFERSITRLTPEQQMALESIKRKGATLIKGGAGTGKTLVLLEAFKKLKTEAPDESFVFLTYNRTLAKYNRYLAHLLNQDELKETIDTVDSFFLKILKKIIPNAKVGLDLIGTLVKQFNTTDFFTNDQLFVEIEQFIFAYHVTREEYIHQKISRRGLGIPLQTNQRTQIWEIVEAIQQWMHKNHTYSRNYARILLLNHLSSIPKKEFILVDETQDLTATELRILNQITKEAIILAGDVEQTIYGFSSPYHRAGIDTVGRSRILTINFRNTIPISELAERYRKRQSSSSEAIQVTAFREGPAPELYVASRETLQNLLCRKIELLLDRLKYDPENILILATTNQDVEFIEKRLEKEGYLCANIREYTFDFKETGKIRLSTLHSSKGLDSPVVLIFLSSPLPTPQFDSYTLEKLQRNLLYVALTRAMDQVHVFISEELTHASILDLISAFPEPKTQERRT